MLQPVEDKKNITNPFGSGKNHLTPESNEVIGDKIEREVVPKGEIKIPIPQEEKSMTQKDFLPEVNVNDKEGTNYLNTSEIAKLETIPNPDLEGITLSSPLATRLDENVVKKNTKCKKIKLVCGVFAVLLLILFIFLSLLAFSVGRNNSTLSSIAKTLPIENIPIVNLFIKSPELMVIDGLMFSDDKSKGNEIDLKTVTTRGNKNESVHMNLKAGDEKYMLNLNDDKNTSIEILVPSLTEQYFKFNLSNLEEFSNNPLFNNPAAKAILNLYGKYNNKYIKMADEKRVPKVTDPDFFKPENSNNGISELQADNLRIDVANLQINLKPKFIKFFENELTKLNTFIKVKNMGRAKVRDMDTFELSLEFSPSDLEKYKLLLRPSLTSLLVDSSNDLARMVCHGSNVTTTQTFSVNNLETCITTTSKNLSDAFIQDQASFINSFGIKNVNMYSDIETGRIVKYEFTIYDALNEAEVNSVITFEVIPLKEDLNVTAPTESEKFRDFLKDLFNTLPSQIN